MLACSDQVVCNSQAVAGQLVDLQVACHMLGTGSASYSLLTSIWLYLQVAVLARMVDSVQVQLLGVQENIA